MPRIRTPELNSPQKQLGLFRSADVPGKRIQAMETLTAENLKCWNKRDGGKQVRRYAWLRSVMQKWRFGRVGGKGNGAKRYISTATRYCTTNCRLKVGI
jgi:hypothetical protein